MRVAVTGADGFIGRAVVERIASGAIGPVSALRLLDLRPASHPVATAVIVGSYADQGPREQLLEGGCDILFHLASLPGGAAESDFACGRAANLTGSLDLFDAAAAAGRGATVVYTSSIAALWPNTHYGVHKRMCELYLADLTRAGYLDGRALRPSGIVARPVDSYVGFATAWMSDMFRALAAGQDFACPLRATSQVWLQSVSCAADNIVRAATMPGDGLAPERAWTLPPTAPPLGVLADEILRQAGSGGRASFGTDAFSQPPPDDAETLALGFRSDGDANSLVRNVLAQLKKEAS